MRYLILLLFLIGCGTDEVKTYDKRSTYQEKEFIYYVKSFDNHYNRHTLGKFEMRFANLDDPVAGYCNLNIPRNIVIDKSYWMQSDELSREALIFHELGHCELNLGHDMESIDVGADGSIARSIMYPVNVGDYWYYGPHRKYYIKQLLKETATFLTDVGLIN